MITKLDLNILDTHNSKTIGIADVSLYNPLIPIESIELEIYAPGYRFPAKPFFAAKSVNILNSNNIGLTKATCEEELVDLPDGLWRIKYSICPNDKLFIEKFFLRTYKIECKLSECFLNLSYDENNEEDVKNLKKINEIELFINGAIAAANNKNTKLAIQFYARAAKLINKYLKSNCKNDC